MVNSGVVFFGFSLHHLFMHMNKFRHHSLCTPFGALQVVVFGVRWHSGTHRIGRGEGGRGIITVSSPGNCTMNAEIVER